MISFLLINIVILKLYLPGMIKRENIIYFNGTFQFNIKY